VRPRPGGEARARGVRRPGRFGGAALPLVLLCGAVALLGWRGLERRAAERGFGWIDPATLDVAGLPGWVDPRWRLELEELLFALAPVRSDDEAGLAAIAGAIAELSFVARVGRPEVVWPHGLRLAIELREPVACVPTGRRYRMVASDGTLLSGLWPTPPCLGGSCLPVIGPREDEGGLFDLARAGDWLAEPEHTDALDVALSLLRTLEPRERTWLGPVVIDASRARRASVAEPGVRLELVGERVALFGRTPSSGEPGELEAETKWRSLVRALALADSPHPAAEWTLVDLRWDRPELALREPLLAEAAPPRPLVAAGALLGALRAPGPAARR
jgi:hypothetical protein